MRVTCVGGGPAGLYAALLLKRLDPAHEVTVLERNRPDDTFGWGVVFSDQTLANMRACDAPTAAAIERAFNHWDDIDVRIHGRSIRSGGHGFVGIGRHRLLGILQERCRQLGVVLRFEHEVDPATVTDGADLVIAADGINSATRARHAAVFRPDVVVRPNRYVWLGTTKLWDAFTFVFEPTAHGWFQAHVYRFDETTSTFIVECTEETWRAHGLDTASAEASVAFCERLFAGVLDGHRLLSNARHLRGSPWLAFQRVACAKWWTTENGVPVVLMGDAVHTAHFAIGSGTKLAIEDAIEFVRQLQRHGTGPTALPAVLDAWEAIRKVDVLRLQNAAWNAMEWFEHVGRRYADVLPPEQFTYSLLTRSQRIGHENLRLRDAAWLDGYERWFAARAGIAVPPGERPPPPMFTPFTVRDVTLRNRVIVSPMAQYSAVDGVPGDYHLVHLGARAMGGAAMVVAEMTCVTADARITPGCPGLWNTTQRDAWARIVRWVHDHTDAKIALQLGHAGAKGATRVAWEGIDLPLAEGDWPLVAASPQAYVPGTSREAREITHAEMDELRDRFVQSTLWAAEAGFDWLELHCAHGYLLSSFISPLTNRRTDAYGGPLAHRLRWPLEVFRAMRAAWPAGRPMSVRISAHDWVPGGITPADATEIARAFKEAGVDMIDCSSGQVSKAERPVYGRMWQAPFADRIRNEAGIPTIAVGAITEGDQVNAIVAAGRADLCAVARPHLANPAWTLHEAAKQGWTQLPWPKPYLSGKAQLETLAAREREAARVATAQAPMFREES